MRISQRQQIAQAISYLHENLARTEKVRAQIGSQQRILRPDEDPQGTQQAIHTRSRLNLMENALRNLSVSSSWMEATATALGELTKILTKARLEAERGASETLSADIRQTIAAQTHEYFQQAINVGNTQHLGKHIFAGYRIDQAPFVADLVTHTFVYQGDSGRMQHDLEPGTRTDINITGDHPLFSSTLNALRDLYDALATNDTAAIRQSINAIDTAIDLCLQAQAETGARLRVVSDVRERMERFQVDLKSLLSQIEDVDLPEAILHLNSHEQTYQAMLNVASRIMPTSLFDYLR